MVMDKVARHPCCWEEVHDVMLRRRDHAIVRETLLRSTS